ncbi:hypothetical protein [Methanohalophilus euhalobius]|uniref:hypothetical protein n=1 Tax=Methanohalophilus euhalobius TaxID=51203 RepID=UPI0011B0EC12|nr:hypothetical protein [Methanohalophilus euhalobius]
MENLIHVVFIQIISQRSSIFRIAGDNGAAFIDILKSIKSLRPFVQGFEEPHIEVIRNFIFSACYYFPGYDLLIQKLCDSR